MNKIPRIIWFLWFQGVDSAPLVVQRCLSSWQEKNPGWEVKVLTAKNLENVVRLNVDPQLREKISPALLSDLVRLKLLRHYGGVWVDATCFCVKPLDSWIDVAAASGFFAFRQSKPDRLAASWFLAARPEHLFVCRLDDALNQHLNGSRFNNRGKRWLISLVGRFANRSHTATRLWSTPFVTKFLRICPYFIFHYKFNDLVRNDSECRAIWEATMAISADGPHALQRFGLTAELTDESRKTIDDALAPVYKLTYKYPQADYRRGCVLDHLFATK